MYSEINRCLQHFLTFNNQPLYESKSLLQMSTFLHQEGFQKKLLILEDSNFKFEDFAITNFNEKSPFNFSNNEEDEEIMPYKQLNFEDEENDEDEYEEYQEEQDFEIKTLTTNFTQTLQNLKTQPQNKQQNQDIFEKFNQQFTPKNHVPSLFVDEQHYNKQSVEKPTYKPIRERIQERLEKQKEEKQKVQVISNRFARASLSPASRYHSKSPQSQFTKEFEQKFNQFNNQYNSQFNSQTTLQNYQSSTPKAHQNCQGQVTTPKRLRTDQVETTTQIRIDIQNFQDTQKKYLQEKKQPENVGKIQQKSKINSHDFHYNPQKKQITKEQAYQSPNRVHKLQQTTTVQKENCKYLVINLYQKKL